MIPEFKKPSIYTDVEIRTSANASDNVFNIEKHYWLLNNNGEAFVYEFPQPNAIHVIEYSSYEKLKTELVFYKNGNKIKEVHYDEPAHIIKENSEIQLKLNNTIQCLNDLKNLDNHLISEEVWRIDKCLNEIKD